MTRSLAVRHLATALNGLSFLWVAAASVYLLTTAGYDGIQTAASFAGDAAAVGHLETSLVEANGPWVVALLMLVSLLSLVPFGVTLTRPEGHRTVTFIVGFVLLGFSLIAGFSVGLMYLPPALIMLAAGASSIAIRGESEIDVVSVRGRGALMAVLMCASMAAPVAAQDTSGAAAHTRIGAGAAVGVLLPAVILPAGLGHSSCTGSGNYLTLCRGAYALSVVLGGGLGAWVGHEIERAEPAGAVSSVLKGAAAGALVNFLLSVPLCEQNGASNPSALCARSGFPTLTTASAFAVGGGVLAGILRSTSRSASRPPMDIDWSVSPDGSVGLFFRVSR